MLKGKHPVSENKKKLLDKISAREARVGVVGLGYVGLPLVVEFARGGFDSTGFEVDSKKADAINRGESNPPRANSTDRKSTRLNSSHLGISYAVFCLKKKRKS